MGWYYKLILKEVVSRLLCNFKPFKDLGHRDNTSIHELVYPYNILLQTSCLVASEILKHQTPSARATVIEKWAAVAEVCRNLHNFNSVLEITSAFMSSSIYRLRKTWEKVSKQVGGKMNS